MIMSFESEADLDPVLLDPAGYGKKTIPARFSKNRIHIRFYRIQAKPDLDPAPVQETWSWIRSGST